jgi:hypothetical protein
VEKISELAYKLELPEYLKGTYPVISVEHLEPAPTDPYQRDFPEPGPLQIEDGTEKYIIEKKILDREMRSIPRKKIRETWYKVKWHGYEETSWESRSTLATDVPNLVRDFERGRMRDHRTA